MSAIHLDRLLHPKSVAEIGASERKGSVGAAVMENLRVSGFSGEVFPVNPNRRSVQGKTAFGSLTEIGRPIDLTVIATPIATASAIVGDGIAAGAGGAVIISAGGKEIGPKGREIEAAIKKRTEGSDFRIIGPNCLGVISSRSCLNASFAGRMPLSGKLWRVRWPKWRGLERRNKHRKRVTCWRLTWIVWPEKVSTRIGSGPGSWLGFRVVRGPL